MSGVTIALLLFGGMLLLMAIRVPIAMAMMVPGVIGYVAIAGWPSLLNAMKGLAFARLANYDLTVIPLFLLMGAFASQGGLSRSLFLAANAVIGHLRGGLAMAAVLACAAFGSICGSSIATAATMAKVALPEMRAMKYSGRLSTGALAAGGTLGIMIPPSVILVLYAILAEQNIAKLFAAALIPGLIATVGYCIAIAVYVRLPPGGGPGQRAPQPAAAAGRVEGRLAGGRRLPARLRRHLHRLVHADRGRRHRRGGHLRRRDRCAASSTWPASRTASTTPR